MYNTSHMVYICYITSDNNDANIIQKLGKLYENPSNTTRIGMGKRGT